MVLLLQQMINMGSILLLLLLLLLFLLLKKAVVVIVAKIQVLFPFALFGYGWVSGKTFFLIPTQQKKIWQVLKEQMRDMPNIN
jgi:hypothetical protein